MKSPNFYWAGLNNKLTAGVGGDGHKQTVKQDFGSQRGCLLFVVLLCQGPEISGGPFSFKERKRLFCQSTNLEIYADPRCAKYPAKEYGETR